jgi:hypothetical protein
MPQGHAIDGLAPTKVGAFRRTSTSSDTAAIDGPVYVNYDGPGPIFMEIGLMERPEWARDAVVTAAGEMTSSFPADPRFASRDTEPSYFFHRGPDGSFFAWTRGRYFFSAHAKTGDAALDAFMRAFPF